MLEDHLKNGALPTVRCGPLGTPTRSPRAPGRAEVPGLVLEAVVKGQHAARGPRPRWPWADAEERAWPPGLIHGPPPASAATFAATECSAAAVAADGTGAVASAAAATTVAADSAAVRIVAAFAYVVVVVFTVLGVGISVLVVSTYGRVESEVQLETAVGGPAVGAQVGARAQDRE